MTDIIERPGVVEHSSAVLTTPAVRLDFGQGESAVAQANLLEQTLIEGMKGKNCLGLSAVQLGINVQAFALNVYPPQCVFNPRLIDQTTDGDVMDEACLSFPGLVAKVWRPKAIKVRFQTADGFVHTEKYTGMTARVFLHEMDHCLGRVFFDGDGKMQLTMNVKRSAKRGHPYNVAALWKIAEASRANRA